MTGFYLDHYPHSSEIVNRIPIPVSNWLLENGEFLLLSATDGDAFLIEHRLDLINRPPQQLAVVIVFWVVS